MVIIGVKYLFLGLQISLIYWNEFQSVRSHPRLSPNFPVHGSETHPKILFWLAKSWSHLKTMDIPWIYTDSLTLISETFYVLTIERSLTEVKTRRKRS